MLKSDWQVEKRQFDDAEDLLKRLAFDAFTAWRVFDLQRTAKYQPDRLAQEMVSAEEISVQRMLLHRD